MTAIDRRGLVELARDELAGWPIGSGYYGTKLDVDEAREMAEAALPVIVAAVLKPIREQHGVPHWCMDDEGRSDCYHPDGPGMPWPCPTARLCDEIEAAAKGGE